MESGDYKVSPQFKNLSAGEFKKKLSESSDGVLLDVRTQLEFQNGSIPGALNIDVLELSFREEAAQLEKDKTYFVYYRSGGRSSQARAIMTELGFNVYNLSGGISNWTGNIR